MSLCNLRAGVPLYEGGQQQLEVLPRPTGGRQPVPWGLNRRGYWLRVREFENALAERLKTGEDAAKLNAGDLDLGQQPRTPATGGGRGGGPIPVERLSATIWLDRVAAAAQFATNSWGPIPWPFEVVGCIVSSGVASIAMVHWGLFVNDTHIEGNFTNPPGQPLTDSVFGPASDFTLSNGGNPYMNFTETGSTTTIAHDFVANSALGRTIHESGKHLTLVIRDEGATQKRIGVTVTVQRLAPLQLGNRDGYEGGLTSNRPRSTSAAGSLQPSASKTFSATPYKTCYTRVNYYDKRDFFHPDVPGPGFYWEEVRDGKPGAPQGPFAERYQADAAANAAKSSGDVCQLPDAPTVGTVSSSSGSLLPMTSSTLPGGIYGVYGDVSAFKF